MQSTRALAWSVWLGAALVGCNQLLGTEEGTASSPTSVLGGDAATAATESGDRDSSIDDAANTDASTAPITLPKAGPPPPDSNCRGTWVAPPPGEPTCANRRTMLLRTGVPAPPALAIERSRSGRIAVAVSHMTEDDEVSALDVVQFTDAAHPDVYSLSSGAFDAIALAKWGTDDLLLAYHGVPTNEIDEVELGPKGPVRPTEVIATGIAAPTYVSIATNSSLAAHVAYFDPTAKAVYARGRADATSAWTTSLEVDHGFVTNGLAGSGQVSAALDEHGIAYVAYHRAGGLAYSFPNFKTLVNGLWGFPKQLDQDGVDGYGIALGIFGEDRYTAFFGPPNSGAATRSLRFASWKGNEANRLEIEDNRIPADDPLAPTVALAMAIDAFGLMHLVVTDREDGKSVVRYIRQTISDGDPIWLEDFVDEFPVAANSPPTRVAIVLDDASRPHIVYSSPVDDGIHYATYADGT